MVADLENCKLPLDTRPAGEHGFGLGGFRGCHLVQVFANGTVISAAVGGRRMTNPQSGSQWGFGLEPNEPPGREGLGGWRARALGMYVWPGRIYLFGQYILCTRNED